MQFEVPWREGAATRTANHNDLLRLLFPLSKVPFSEINSAAVTLMRQLVLQFEHRWLLDCKVFVSPTTGERVVVLNNRLTGWIDASPIFPHLDLVGWNIVSVYGKDAAVFEGGVSFTSPAVVRVRADATTPEIDPGAGDIVIHLLVSPVGAEKPIVVESKLSTCEQPINAQHLWATHGTRRPWDQPQLPVLYA